MATGDVILPDTNLMIEAGAILWAPLGTALPTNTVAGGVFTDDWDVAWVPLGRTTDGLKVEDNASNGQVESAEDYYPLAYRTTKREATVSFNLMNFTASNLARALNGAVTTVTGSTLTTLTQLDAPNPVEEVPCMIGWQSLDKTARFIARQVRNSGNLTVQMQKAPNAASIPWTASLEKPAGAQPYSWFFAGETRA